jgi:hypothetical protein
MEIVLLVAIMVGIIFVGGAVCFARVSGPNNSDVGKAAMLELPNGDVVVGKIEELYRWSESNYEVVIDGETYVVHPTDFAVIPTDYPVGSPVED